jgi:hypothetical protein
LLLAQRAPTLNSMRSQALSLLLAVALFGTSAHVKADSDVSGIRGREDVLLLNSDAIVGARLWLHPGSASSAFLYADVGATNSSLRWQGLAGIHGSHGIDLVGGWRRVTHHYAPGFGVDSLDFDGPFLGATLAL